MTVQPTRGQLLDMTEDLRVLGDRPDLCDKVVDGLWAALDQAEAERDEARATKDMHKERAQEAIAERDRAQARIQAVRDVLTYYGTSRVSSAAVRRALDGDTDGDPTRPCGRGPCCLGAGHPGDCHL